MKNSLSLLNDSRFASEPPRWFGAFGALFFTRIASHTHLIIERLKKTCVCAPTHRAESVGRGVLLKKSGSDVHFTGYGTNVHL